MSLGNVAIISSGETSPSGGIVYRKLFSSTPHGLRIAILETPAGFELNSARVAGRVGDYITLRAGEFSPRVDVIPARRKGTAFSPDAPEILQPLAHADWIYLGAGSPTYAVRQLRGSLAWRQLLACWQQGAGLVLASAAALAVGAFTLPVYEIFKVGEDPEWKPGLDLFAGLGWKLAVVSHWNNTDGGEELDTSRCFIGRERFDVMLGMLPPEAAVLGLDEHTAAILNWESGRASVEGRGAVTVLRGGEERVHPAGEEFPLEELGEYRMPSKPFGAGEDVWKDVSDRRSAGETVPVPPAQVAEMIARRERARRTGDYAAADALRTDIERLGWTVMDTPRGSLPRPK
ncbi:MAG: hypothetical protein JW929_08970 [Anaerolineales bacterium]|nr:hypothetical protein [Anaerolineales bacterium]